MINPDLSRKNIPRPNIPTAVIAKRRMVALEHCFESGGTVLLEHTRRNIRTETATLQTPSNARKTLKKTDKNVDIPRLKFKVKPPHP